MIAYSEFQALEKVTENYAAIFPSNISQFIGNKKKKDVGSHNRFSPEAACTKKKNEVKGSSPF